MSAETRAAGASILLAVDGLFLGSLLFIQGAARHAYLVRLRELGVASPAWPDAGDPQTALPWAAAGAAALAAGACRLRTTPLAPLVLIAAAIACTTLALDRMAATGAGFGVGRYGTLATILAVVWIAHLLGAIVALGRGVRSWRFMALQAAYGIGLAAMVF